MRCNFIYSVTIGTVLIDPLSQSVFWTDIIRILLYINLTHLCRKILVHVFLFFSYPRHHPPTTPKIIIEKFSTVYNIVQIHNWSMVLSLSSIHSFRIYVPYPSSVTFGSFFFFFFFFKVTNKKRVTTFVLLKILPIFF